MENLLNLKYNEKLPFIFGQFNSIKFLNLKKLLNKSKFNLKILNQYFLPIK